MGQIGGGELLILSMIGGMLCLGGAAGVGLVFFVLRLARKPK